MVGMEAMVENLAATVAEASSSLARQGAPVAPLGVYCLAGVDLAVDEERVGAAVRDAGWTDRCDVRNDAFAVLRAGATGASGVGVVCGTGLNCVGVGADGRHVRFPSLGELSGDFTPGGAWLGDPGAGAGPPGRRRPGRPRPPCARRVPDYLGLPTPEAVLEAVYTGELPFGRLMELARVALEAADAGDAPLRAAVDQLVEEVVAMAGATLAARLTSCPQRSRWWWAGGSSRTAASPTWCSPACAGPHRTPSCARWPAAHPCWGRPSSASTPWAPPPTPRRARLRRALDAG